MQKLAGSAGHLSHRETTEQPGRAAVPTARRPAPGGAHEVGTAGLVERFTSTMKVTHVLTD